MKKEYIVVPKGIRYIGELDENGKQKWDYDLGNFGFPHILNKKLTGCGFTEYCLRNHQNIILVSPRKFLLDNKEEQHPGEVYYMRNEVELSSGYDTLLDGKPVRHLTEKQKKALYEDDKVLDHTVSENLEIMKKNLIKAYTERDKSKPFKILVTYDSFRHVKDALKNYTHEFMGNIIKKDIFNEFQVVVDEFQSIFIDSRFKSDTELELLDNLEGVQRVCYVSATPILEKYLDRLDEFKNLPYYELDWESADPGRVRKPELEVRFTSSLTKACKDIIQSYLKKKYEVRIDTDTKETIESKEATLFFNSVSGICQAIRTNRLHLENCNILCADTEENRKTVRKAFNDVLRKEHDEKVDSGEISRKDKIGLLKPSEKIIGKIPVKGEPHKMFTFCTRTVYLGADFYSTNSRTFVFSDSNIDCLSVDISMDLEQILGRQRLDENPWKNTALMYVKTTKEDKKNVKRRF